MGLSFFHSKRGLTCIYNSQIATHGMVSMGLRGEGTFKWNGEKYVRQPEGA